ncbi:D-lactaldehyde dehydrogenase [Auriculariales sp. MPI-PUGE-AT-0066]|nr:D-lactaldehyde dehydrogenase [Auriculariales sp. MPI-PUGE-AT-0066]
MPAVPPPAKVLVTGASGFLAAHVVKALLARGYTVRGTVRSHAKGEYLAKLFEKDYPGAFEFVIVRDIAQPGAFDEAVIGVDAVAHTASPVEWASPEDPPEKLIKPAVEGTLFALRSAATRGTNVKRVVVTASYASILEPHDGPYEYSEEDWNDFSVKEAETRGKATTAVHKYRASKTLAERAVWNFLTTDKPAFDAVTINPPFIYGPIIHDIGSIEQLNLSTMQLWQQFVRTDLTPEVTSTYLGNHIDVRDVAEAHVDAIAREDLAGRRLVIGCGPIAPQDICEFSPSR